MEWWPFLIFHRGGLRIKVINNSNHRFYDAFVAWAAGRAHVLDDGATTNETRLGAVQDLALAWIPIGPVALTAFDQ